MANFSQDSMWIIMIDVLTGAYADNVNTFQL